LYSDFLRGVAVRDLLSTTVVCQHTPDLRPPNSPDQLTIVFGVFCRRKWTELDSRISMNWSANFFGNGQNWITKSLHQRSGIGVAVLGPVRPLMEDTLSKPS